VSPSLDNEDFNFENLFHRYGEPPAQVVAEFSTGAYVRVFIGGQDRVHGVFVDRNGTVASSAGTVRKLGIGRIAILPQIEPLREVEVAIEEARVKRFLSSNLASKHFRNQLRVFRDDYFQAFKDIAESTWHGLQIKDLLARNTSSGRKLELHVRNDDFVSEVGWTGHGLQMWLQTMWFLARSRTDETVILDEPDVYMHADLQRRLIRTVKGRHPQVIIATHSIEIMDEVDPADVLVIDRDRRKARFAGDIPAVQDVVSTLGGVHNIQLARLWNAKRCLFIEGDDVRILRRFHDVLFGTGQESLDIIPKLPIGGWNGWPYVVGSAMLMEQNIGRDIQSYAIFDRDYHTPEQISDRGTDAAERGINLHIWTRKEIENFAIAPGPIQRAIKLRGVSTNIPSAQDIRRKIFDFAGEYQDEVMDTLANEFFLQDRAAGLASANARAREALASWNDYDVRLSLAPGKALVSKLSAWAKQAFDTSFNAAVLAGLFAETEVPGEIKAILGAIGEGQPLSRKSSARVPSRSAGASAS
jgi:hypothetical protein